MVGPAKFGPGNTVCKPALPSEGIDTSTQFDQVAKTFQVLFERSPIFIDQVIGHAAND